jgi:hypothetical protein
LLAEHATQRAGVEAAALYVIGQRRHHYWRQYGHQLARILLP